jgi:hypothetical protein
MALASSASALTMGLMWRDLNPAQMELVKRSGATGFRLNIDRSFGNWETYDAIFTAAWQRGITISPNLTDRSLVGFPIATEVPVWNAWVTQVVQRYGVGGTFWAGKVNPTPVTSWSVWNEPNLADNSPKRSKEECEAISTFPYMPEKRTCLQPASYGVLLGRTAETIHGINAGAKVYFGGLYMGAEVKKNYIRFLEQASPTAGPFDGLEIHPYSFFGGVSEVAAEVTEIRSTLNKLPGGTAKPLSIGEIGWPVSSPGGTGVPAVNEAEQASLLTGSFDWIKEHASADKIEAAYWYNLRDTSPRPEVGPRWDNFTGLMDFDTGAMRPSWFAFLKETGASGVLGPPAALATASGTDVVFVTGNDVIKRFSRASGAPAWSAEVVATGAFTSAPTVYVSPGGSEEVFVTTNTGIDHFRRPPGGFWNGEVVATGSGFISAPVAYLGSGGNEEVFVTGDSGLLHFRRSPGGSPWGGEVIAAGSGFTSAPAAFTRPNGTEDVYVTTTGGINHYQRSGTGGWGGEVVTGGAFTSGPAAYISPSGAEEVYVSGGNGIFHFRRAAGGSSFGGEVVATGEISSTPVAYSSVAGNEEVFATAANGLLHFRRSPGGGPWGGEVIAAGSGFTPAPAAFTRPNGTEDVYVTTGAGINHYQRSGAGGWGGEVVTGFGQPSAEFRLISKNSGKCMDIVDFSIKAGTEVQQWDCRTPSEAPNQAFYLKPVEQNYYEIISKNSGKCLDVTGASMTPGTHLQQFDCLGGGQANQLWKLEPQGGGFVQLVAKHSGQCADVVGVSLENGAKIQQFPCLGAGAANQLWKVEELK